MPSKLQGGGSDGKYGGLRPLLAKGNEIYIWSRIMIMANDVGLPEAFRATIALEEAHHQWYFLTEEKINFVRHVEWILERTTCMQKAALKWVFSGIPAETAMQWGRAHIAEEGELLISDLKDVYRGPIMAPNRDERSKENLPAEAEVITLIENMAELSKTISTGVKAWAQDNRVEPGTMVLAAFIEDVCLIQRTLIAEVWSKPNDIRTALDRAYPAMLKATSQLWGKIEEM
ncbi:MAG: hypothetical protein WCR85_00340 [Sphaerochaeta sp.]